MASHIFSVDMEKWMCSLFCSSYLTNGWLRFDYVYFCTVVRPDFERQLQYRPHIFRRGLQGSKLRSEGKKKVAYCHFSSVGMWEKWCRKQFFDWSSLWCIPADFQDHNKQQESRGTRPAMRPTPPASAAATTSTVHCVLTGLEMAAMTAWLDTVIAPNALDEERGGGG